MDVHARSLLERLNTSTSPKPIKSSSTPEAMPSVAAAPEDVQGGPPSPPSPSNRLFKQPSIGETEDAMSLKDLLDSARQRSRESSVNAVQHLQPNSTETFVQVPPSPSITVKHDHDGASQLSDGASSGNVGEVFATPSGSNNSSVVSNAEDSPRRKAVSVTQTSPQGCRIPSIVSALTTLPPMKPHLPRLQIRTDSNGRTFTGEGIEQIANLARTFGVYDREIIGATSKYIVYALKDGRIRIIDQNTGTRAIAETPSSAPVISLAIRDGSDGEESFLLVLDSVHDITIWSIKPWKIDSADIPLDHLIRLHTAGRRVDQSYPPIAKWWPRYSNCIAVCSGLAVRIYFLRDNQYCQEMDIHSGENAAVSIPVETGVRNFSFSSDGSTLAVIDYHGDILLWALNSDPTFAEFFETSHLESKLMLPEPTLTFVCPTHWNPCSVQFLDLSASQPFTPLLLVGCNYNRRLQTVDITEGVVLQEIVLPCDKSLDMPTQNFTLAYTKENQFLTVSDTLSSSLYFFHLDSHPVKTGTAASQSEYLINVVQGKVSQSSSIGPPPLFDYVTELPFLEKHSLQTIAVTPSHDALLDVFTAHSNGFSMLLPALEDLLPANYKDAQSALTRPLQTCHLHRKGDVGTPNRVPRSPRQRPVGDQSPRPRGRSPQTPKENSVDAFQRSLQQVERSHATSQISDKEVTTPEISPKDIVTPSPDKRPILPANRLPELREQTLDQSATPEATDGGKDLEAFITRALQDHYQKMTNHEKDLTAAADERHEAILKVVASTLTSNVGKVLEQVVRSTIEKSVLPAINSNFKKSMDQQLGKTLSSQIEKTLPKELRSSISGSIQRSLFENDGGGKLSDAISKAVVAKLEVILQKDLTSRLGTIFEKSLGPMVNKLEERVQSSVDKALQRIQKEMRASQQDTAKKIDALMEAVEKLGERAKVVQEEKSVSHARTPSTASSRQPSRRDNMAEQFKIGAYSAGVEIWSDANDGEQSALFDVCLEYQPTILEGVEQLTLMTTANSIAIDLKTRLDERLTWLQKIMSLARKEGRYTEYWPRVLSLLDQRLEAAFHDVSKSGVSPFARKIAITQYNVQKKLEEFKA